MRASVSTSTLRDRRVSASARLSWKCSPLISARPFALFRKAKGRAEIKGLHFHDSRAEALTRLSRKVDVLTLARIVGHRDPRSLMIYYRESAEDIATRID